MSATDSDNSIDWLASDNEDNESEWESDCTRKHSQTEAPPSPSAPPHLGPSDGSCLRSSEVKEVREASSWGSTPGCTETYDSAIGLSKAQGEKTNGKNTQQALKRHHISAEEEQRKERQLISSMSEKDRIFSRKVRNLCGSCSFPGGRQCPQK